jgi:regulator of protease activity HflC (stomatin/prohibitin superfamily)
MAADEEKEVVPTEQFPRFVLAMLVWLPIPFIAYWVLSPYMSTAWAVGLSIIALIMWVGWTFDVLTFYTPETKGTVLFDIFGGDLNAYGPGLKFKLPQENFKPDNQLSLELINKNCEETFLSKDNLLMRIKLNLGFKAALERLANYLMTDPESVERAVLARVKAWITAKFAGKTGKEIIPLLPTVQKEFAAEFKGMRDEVERDYGVDIVTLIIKDIEYPPEVQQINDALAATESIGQIADKLAESKVGEKILASKDGASKLLSQAMVLAGKALGINVSGRGGGAVIVDSDNDGENHRKKGIK